ncbi:MAG TPA: shikimate kinase [Aggregatilineaceae bacterium]|nr:shikimate kinase [Aggregatilineaceae bacterium]
MLQQMARIVIIGNTGSGKTTLARTLAQRLDRPHIELDALFWEPDWKQAETAVFRARVAEAIAGEQWVIDGNNHRVRDLVWARAELLIWLDYPLRVHFWRLMRRTLRRVVHREELWNGNRETWKAQFLSRDSLFVWLFKGYRRHRREWPVALERYSHLTVIRLRSPRETEKWLAQQLILSR